MELHLRCCKWTFTLVSLLALTTGLQAQPFRTIDGTDNNLANPLWGSSDTPLLRVGASEYGDGVSTPAGASRPGARAISNALCAQNVSLRNTVGASDYVWQWGQFLDHDIDLTGGADPAEPFPIPVPLGDPWFDPGNTGTQEMGFDRSAYDPGSSPREQLNGITSWIDGSNVYGSDVARAMELRLLDGSGKLKTSPGDLLPFNVNAFPNAQPGGADPATFFLAGDVRANEQVALTALHTLFVREHNRLCDEIQLADPMLSDEDIYLRARRIVGAQMQVITYNEFLPALLGPGALDPYTGYDSSFDPGIRNSFSTASYRFGHSMLSAELLRLEESGFAIAEGNLALRDSFFDPTRITDEGGIEPLLRGLSRQLAQNVDPRLVDEVRNFLFGPPGSGGFDLASLNLQRGRDHGLQDYNQLRLDYGLTAVTSFSDITSDPALVVLLTTTYGDVNEIDAWVGGLAEDHVPGAMVGELVLAVLEEQFEALRDGDRFWYQIDFSGAELADLEGTTLADVIRRNTPIVDIADNVFQVDDQDFTRGDCNLDTNFDIADSITLLQALFVSGAPILCEDACDANDDGGLDISDAIRVLTAIFLQGDPPEAPYPGCGPDPTGETLTCPVYPGCP